MFFKKKLKCSIEASYLITAVSEEAIGNWHIAEKMLVDASNKYTTAQLESIHENNAIFLILAVLQAELQVAENLCGNDIYLSLRKHIVTLLGESYGKEEIDSALITYKQEYDNALERGENPMQYGLSSAVYYALKLPNVSDDTEEFQSPMLLLAISTLIMSYIGTIKKIHKKFKLIPD